MGAFDETWSYFKNAKLWISRKLKHPPHQEGICVVETRGHVQNLGLNNYYLETGTL